MRFLHTSDWHLGKSDGDTPLFDDQRFFIDEICRIIKERSVDAVLLAGDVYDRSVASAEAVRLYDRAMTDICLGCGVPVFTIAGNHDSAERLASCGELLSRAGLYIRGELCADVAPIAFGDAEVFLLPWITEEKVKAVFPEEKENICDLTAAYAVVTAKMRESFSPDKKHLLLAHAFTTDAETSTSDRAAEIGFATRIPASVFEGFDYVALGHIHGAQRINDRVRYCGTPMPYSFGKEEKQVKSVVIFDTETAEQELVPLPLLHKRSTLKGTFEELLNAPCDEETRKGYVRLEVTDSFVGLEALSQLKQVYPRILEICDKNFEKTDGTVTLSTEKLEQMESDPLEVFRWFCREEMELEADEHLAELFQSAVAEAEKEAEA